MGEWTPEPWETYGASVFWSRTGKATVGACGEPRGNRHVGYKELRLWSPHFDEACANADRIVDCVNALAGLNPAGVRDLIEVLRAYEKWEADLVLCRGAWDSDDGLPRMTQELYDRWLEIQSMRNAALSNIKATQVTRKEHNEHD